MARAFSLSANAPFMWQHKGLNVLLSTEKQQHCSCLFVAFCLHNFPKHFLHRLRRSSPHSRRVLGGNWFFVRFSSVRFCPRVTPPAADTTPRLPAIHVPSFVHWHTVPTDWFVFSYFCFVWRMFLFSLFIILLILFLLNFQFSCLDSSWAGIFPEEKWGVHTYFFIAGSQ